MPFYERLQSRSRRLFPTVAFGSILFPVFSFPCAGLAHGAGSPFEIELRELEREPEAVKKPEPAASSGKQADRKDARETGTDGTPPTGGYVRYTMRPGDHLYKVLTMRFGLSSAKAEALIPEIKRINGITDTSRLQIGQTILLPLSRKKRTVVVKPTPAPLPKPSRAPAPVEPPEQQAPAAESPPPFSKAERGIVRRAVAFWARLFPGSDSGSAGPETGETGSADIPVLTGID
ncbi:MAG TPA: hypothetical protein PLI53_10855, partial [Geobacteraceae bacterium]|nr:hypothetical protein [Geobacteraceae bacterium]